MLAPRPLSTETNNWVPDMFFPLKLATNQSRRTCIQVIPKTPDFLSESALGLFPSTHSPSRYSLNTCSAGGTVLGSGDEAESKIGLASALEELTTQT